MTLDQLLTLVGQLSDAIKVLQASQAQFSQADIDAAVKKITDADAASLADLTAKLADLQAKVDASGPAQTKAVADALAGQSQSFIAVLTAIKTGEDKGIDEAIAALTPVVPPVAPAPAAPIAP